MIQVSVIIPTYKDNNRLNKCIKALNQQTFPKDQFEVIIVNNDPEIDVNITAKHSLNLKILREPQSGSYAARNLGIKHAKGEILAFTDSDCIPHVEWLVKGVDKINEYIGGKVLIEGKIELFYRNQNTLSFAESYEKIFGFSHQRIDKTEIPVMITANGFVFSKSFDELGYFNSNLMSGGDTEFSLRAVKKKYNVLFNPESLVYHPARYSLNELANKKKRIFGGKVYKSIYTENQSKFKSLARILIKQIKRHLKEIIQIFIRKRERFIVRVKAVFSVFYILISLIIESLQILISNKAKR